MRGETYARLVRLISCRQSPDRQHGNVVLLPEGAGRSMNRWAMPGRQAGGPRHQHAPDGDLPMLVAAKKEYAAL